MRKELAFFDTIQFNSEGFCTNLYPAKFLLFLLKSLGKNDIQYVDKLIVRKECPADFPVDAIVIVLQLGNGSLINDNFFGTYYKSDNGVHHLFYQRLFNRRHADIAFLKLIELYDNGAESELEIFLRTEVETVYHQFNAVGLAETAECLLDDYIKVNYHPDCSQQHGKAVKQKLLRYHQHAQSRAFHPQLLKQLLKEVVHINAQVSFYKEVCEHNYHPNGMGLGHHGYSIGKIVPDSIVRYQDLAMLIEHKFKNNIKLDFKPKVDYIYKFNFSGPQLRESNPSYQTAEDAESHQLIILTNNFRDNYVNYRVNGYNLNFASCIFAYQAQLINSKMELLVRFKNSNSYTSIGINCQKEVCITETLRYDENGGVLPKDNPGDSFISGEHTVKITAFESASVIRVEMQEAVTINIDKEHQKTLSVRLANNINLALDLVLPVIYKRSIKML